MFNLKIYYKPSISADPVISTFRDGFQWSGTQDGIQKALFNFKFSMVLVKTLHLMNLLFRVFKIRLV